MEAISKLNEAFHDVDLKLNQTINNMDKISSFILDYSTKVPLSIASDVYLIFNLRERIKNLYKNVTKCVSKIREKLSRDIIRVKQLQNKLIKNGSYGKSLDSLKILIRIKDKHKDWSMVIANLNSNFMCNQNYGISAASIMDSIESLSSTKEEYSSLTASNFINQKVLYNGDSIEKVVEKILNHSKDKIKSEQEDTFIAKIMNSLDMQLMVEKYSTETKLNAILNILNQSKDHNPHENKILKDLLEELRTKINNLETNIENINKETFDYMKSIDARSLDIKASVQEHFKVNTNNNTK